MGGSSTIARRRMVVRSPPRSRNSIVSGSGPLVGKCSVISVNGLVASDGGTRTTVSGSRHVSVKPAGARAPISRSVRVRANAARPATSAGIGSVLPLASTTTTALPTASRVNGSGLARSSRNDDGAASASVPAARSVSSTRDTSRSWVNSAVAVPKAGKRAVRAASVRPGGSAADATAAATATQSTAVCTRPVGQARASTAVIPSAGRRRRRAWRRSRRRRAGARETAPRSRPPRAVRGGPPGRAPPCRRGPAAASRPPSPCR